MDTEKNISEIIDLAVREDIGDGDHSSLACIGAEKKGRIRLYAKEEGVVSGLNLAKQIYKRISEDIEVRAFKNDGDEIKTGDEILEAKGRIIPLLQAERLVLNFMQRMSGIATETARYAALISDLPTQILDTRKTTPGLRAIEKYAVTCGGGNNHRQGLYDMVMLKDNHIDFAGGIKQAVESVQRYLKEKDKQLDIEVEVRNFDELKELLSLEGVHRVMLDNFSVSDTKKAVKMIAGKLETESSGGITFESLRQYAEAGVDFISVGALTHQIRSLDLSIKAV